MPGVPGPRLAMIETEFVLGRFEASLDGPTETRDTGQLGKRCSEWCEADEATGDDGQSRLYGRNICISQNLI